MAHNIIDLHVHSCCSDGTLSPEELVDYALTKKLKAFALTDHDTTSGLARADIAAAGTDIEVIHGIEFSTVYLGKDVHILGLDIDENHPDFRLHLEQFQDSRNIRNEKMISVMQKNGISISLKSMHDSFGDAVFTRAHFARYLVEHGYVKDMKEAFLRYLGEGCPYHIPREKVSPFQAVHLIASTGGIPVLAHPLLYHFSEVTLDDLIHSLKKAGLTGIEALYSSHSKNDEALVRQLARKHQLAISGGSDFHGSNKPGLDLGCGYGNLDIPYDILKNLRNRSI